MRGRASSRDPRPDTAMLLLTAMAAEQAVPGSKAPWGATAFPWHPGHVHHELTKDSPSHSGFRHEMSGGCAYRLSSQLGMVSQDGCHGAGQYGGHGTGQGGCHGIGQDGNHGTGQDNYHSTKQKLSYSPIVPRLHLE